jgi:hypothetical protein
MAKANDKEEKVAIFKLVASTFGSFFGMNLASSKLGSKVNEKYGAAIVGAGGLAGSVVAAKSIEQSQPMVALGIVAGSGANALLQTMKVEAIRSRLPDSVQSMLSGYGDQQFLPVVNLNGVDDEALYGDPRVKEIARQMADHEVNETLAALSGAVEQMSLPGPQSDVIVMQEQMNGDYSHLE